MMNKNTRNMKNMYRISLDTDKQIFIATDKNNDNSGTGITIKDAINSLNKQIA
ncbi:hypothetical protein RD055328_04030 [Companilactobacillus sp. RD055328]|uniref:hypothetical protein n=1 Tax=Companilactobacillus sp. RD055328 TaxID=2916634 RepID=UPI001FC84AC9|nr:hypothetical protein [Companilactobacillus sp. RD055328]GKQ42480.1 hypothetical protein RD055328_04030 [Companilactobacillus sp. RD055328]